MPRTQQSLRLTDAYQSRLFELRRRGVLNASNTWRLISITDLDSTFQQWLDVVVGVLTVLQRRGVEMTDAYLAAYLASELDQAVPPAGIDPGEFAGRDDFDRSLSRALLPSLYTIKRARAHQREPDEALQLGLGRASRTISVALAGAPRRAFNALIEDDERVVGWRRLTTRDPCGACLALATGEVLRPDVSLRRHPHCRCVAEAVVAGVQEVVFRPTGEQIFTAMAPADQDALFHGRGGAEKAALLRSGEVQLQDLITQERSALGGPPVVSETPLSALT